MPEPHKFTVDDLKIDAVYETDDCTMVLKSFDVVKDKSFSIESDGCYTFLPLSVLLTTIIREIPPEELKGS